jgi:hypothetical protein
VHHERPGGTLRREAQLAHLPERLDERAHLHIPGLASSRQPSSVASREGLGSGNHMSGFATCVAMPLMEISPHPSASASAPSTTSPGQAGRRTP